MLKFKPIHFVINMNVIIMVLCYMMVAQKADFFNSIFPIYVCCECKQMFEAKITYSLNTCATYFDLPYDISNMAKYKNNNCLPNLCQDHRRQSRLHKEPLGLRPVNKPK